MIEQTEYVDIAQAAKIANVSTKTIRRAIHANMLTDQEPRPNRSRIDINELNTYIANRQSAQMDTRGHVHVDEKEVRIAELECTVASLLQHVQAIENQRIAALETAIQEKAREISDLRLLIEKSGYVHMDVHVGTPMQEPATQDESIVAPVTTREKTSTRRATKQEEPAFTLADFSKGWQSEYKCEATYKDVKAVWILRPYLGNTNTTGDEYVVEYSDWDKVKPTGRVKPEQKTRGEALKNALTGRAIEAMSKSGWAVTRTEPVTIYMKKT
jgi:hypothetical protein